MEHEDAVKSLAVECYLLGEMTPDQREAFEQHYFECPVCAEEVFHASSFVNNAKAVFAGESRTASPRTPARGGRRTPTWLAWLQPRFAAPALAVLVAGLGIQSFFVMSLKFQLAQALAPRASTTAVLRPLTRGELPIVEAIAGEPVNLTFDNPATPELPLRFVLEAAAGHAALSGDLSTAGETASLLIPEVRLAPGMYTLVVFAAADSGNAGKELERYPFKLNLKSK